MTDPDPLDPAHLVALVVRSVTLLGREMAQCRTTAERAPFVDALDHALVLATDTDDGDLYTILSVLRRSIWAVYAEGAAFVAEGIPFLDDEP